MNKWMERIMSKKLLLAGAASLMLLSGWAFAGNCDNPRYAAKNPVECGGEPQGEKKTLSVTVQFGDEYDNFIDCAASPSCAETSFIVTGNVECSSQVCDFVATDIGDTEPFGIAPSLFNMLALTSIRGTQLVPEDCFNIPLDGIPPTEYDLPGYTKETVHKFTLRTPVVADSGSWWADVGARSTDMNAEVQNYTFKFGGQCDRSEGICPALSDASVDGVYESDARPGVFGSGTNRRGEPQTCRCTVSSKPSCPASVDMGTHAEPAVRISVVELP